MIAQTLLWFGGKGESQPAGQAAKASLTYRWALLLPIQDWGRGQLAAGPYRILKSHMSISCLGTDICELHKNVL